MSSTSRSLKNTEQGNAYFINIVQTVSNDFLDETGAVLSPLPAGTGNGIFSQGAIMLRDLGKNIRIPGNGVVSSGNKQRILRLVQRVDTGAQSVVGNSFLNFNEGVGGKADDGINGFETFYIELNGSGPPKWVRIAV